MDIYEGQRLQVSGSNQRDAGENRCRRRTPAEIATIGVAAAIIVAAVVGAFLHFYCNDTADRSVGGHGNGDKEYAGSIPDDILQQQSPVERGK